ncbi:hypothetical protein BTJ68_07190 [Hortaea werneckii EXF-2000]|uniref:DNA replication complex GINS protein PSF3 n=1 Tax=Hortaea werneckii EXF-2000 TaxID=1157616 RepID=A0A1Z5TAB8_HORWE|nr:hypothetical protein BTJ68_07190 [Hortaea werneckii EXF-2000]
MHGQHRQTLDAPSRGKTQAHDSDASRTISHATTTPTLAAFILPRTRRPKRHRPGLKDQNGFQYQQFNPNLLLPNRHPDRLPKSPNNLHPGRPHPDPSKQRLRHRRRNETRLATLVSRNARRLQTRWTSFPDFPRFPGYAFRIRTTGSECVESGSKECGCSAQAPWFYGLGERMLELFEDEEVGEVLLETFKQRALEIADKSQNTRAAMSQAGDSADFMSGLDETERQLFRAAHDGSNAVKKWFDVSSRSS